MINTTKVLAYGFMGLIFSTGLYPAAHNLFEAAEKGLRRCLLQQPIRSQVANFKSKGNATRFFSSIADSDWNTGHVPVKKHVFRLPEERNNKLDTLGSLRTEVTWHFDPLRSLYYYFKENKENLIVKQNDEVKQPIKQDDDMVVYSFSSQKKSLK